METEPQIIAEYVAAGKVRLVYRHLLQLGDGSELLAEYSECAADQGKFWQMRRALYAAQSTAYSDAHAGAAQAAAQAGADIAALDACVSAHTHQAMVEADYAASIKEGVRARPVFVIGARTLLGSQRIETFKQIIDAALAGA
jgi:protein-disulfide isomerase